MTKFKMAVVAGLMITVVSQGFEKRENPILENSFFLTSATFRVSDEKKECSKITVIDYSEEKVEYSFAIADFFMSLFS